MDFCIAPEDSLNAIEALGDENASAALAIIAHTTGPSYRLVGTMMAVKEDGSYVGSLSFGCVEQDVVFNAKEVMRCGQPRTLRYGLGSNALAQFPNRMRGLSIALARHARGEALSSSRR